MQAQKTPVSILQEMMVRMGKFVEYELIHDGGGTHDNTFTYKVTCDGCSATGTGRCKKDAKHSAAKNVLEQIALRNNYPQLPATPGESPVHDSESIVSDTQSNAFHNAVGSLQTLCSENNIDSPKYILIKDEGPPHAKMFTYQCIVSSSFKEEGRAKTKKQAKHEAAQKMLNRLRQVIADRDEVFNLTIENENEEADISAALKFQDLSKTNTRKSCLGVKLSEYHTRLKNTFTDDQRKDVILKLNKILKDYTKNDPEDYEETLKLICNEIEESLSLANISVNIMALASRNENKVLSRAQINFGPDIVEIGIDECKNKADFLAMKKLLDTLVILFT